MDTTLKYELLSQVNLIKSLLAESYRDGEISEKERKNIMSHVGSIKSILYSNDLILKDTIKTKGYKYY